MQKTAIVYDFDGTLAQGNIQEHSFIPALGMKPKQFWQDVKDAARQHDADEILMYMWKMLDVASRNSTSVTKADLRDHGENVPLFEGVVTWFDRMDKYGAQRGLAIEHYVVSSGIFEMIAGCEIFDRFRAVYASKFIYDDLGNAIWPGAAINYTTKTQYLFRINKGIENMWDNDTINQWIPLSERSILFERMIVIGDGETDIPSFKMVRHQGGHAVAVFDPKRWAEGTLQEKVYRLVAEGRVDLVAPADYTERGQLDVTVKGILGRIARDVGYREG